MRRSRSRITHARRGFSLIEVLVALTILATVLVGLASFMTSFVRNTNVDSQRAIAATLVGSRLESIKGTTSYDALDGWEATETDIPGHPGFSRVTTVTRVSSATDDYRIVTVSATTPMLGADSVSRSTIVPRY